MAIIERDVVLQGRTEGGDTTIDLPITALRNVEDTADVKDAPADTDYVPVIDTGDSSQMKKMPWRAVKTALGNGNASTLGGKRAEDFAAAGHTHTAAQISGLPTNLPANGGNADTVDGCQGYQLDTLDANGNSHNSRGFNHTLDAIVQFDGTRFVLKVGSHETRVNYADNANAVGGIDLTHITRFYGYKDINADFVNVANRGFSYIADINFGQQIGLPLQWYHLIHMRHSNDNGYDGQLVFPLDFIGDAYFRVSRGGTWQAWQKFITDTNFAHTHDDRYYTEAEVNNLLNSKAAASHTHTAAQISGLPTSLPANGGNANTVGGVGIVTTAALGLHRMASGTAAANTTNCPVGCWYGQHS